MIGIFKFLLRKKRINPAKRIVLGFALLILAGSFLLMLPIASKTRVTTPFLTALFTATSATCVTGLTLVNTGAYFSLFGQAVILTLIQLGGLGFVTILCLAFFVSNRQIGLRNRMMIAQSMGTESLEGIVKLVKHVLVITAVVELFGAAALAIRFVPSCGILNGIWKSVFHSVSAFCNAGFDVVGDGMSMISYRHDSLVLITLAMLVIIGGLGFVVWEDIIRKKSLKRLGMYSKLVLITTVLLIVSGTAIYFIFERNNPLTIENESVFQKILACFFQSVTTRTAGFDAILQNNLTEMSKVWGIVLMMIGGASGSTAGGVKTGTFALVVLTLYSVLRSRPDVVVFGRRIGHSTILHAMSLLVLWLILTVAGAVLISFFDSQPILNAFYETASAYSTVGLTVGVTENSSVFTKALLIIYMFFGRVGIMTISVTFMQRSGKAKDIKYPEGTFIVG